MVRGGAERVTWGGAYLVRGGVGGVQRRRGGVAEAALQFTQLLLRDDELLRLLVPTYLCASDVVMDVY